MIVLEAPANLLFSYDSLKHHIIPPGFPNARLIREEKIVICHREVLNQQGVCTALG